MENLKGKQIGERKKLRDKHLIRDYKKLMKNAPYGYTKSKAQIELGNKYGLTPQGVYWILKQSNSY